MKIKWYGHSAFKLTMADGVSIIIDPYESGGLGGVIGYDPITDAADAVLISHDHEDHNYTDGIRGNFTVIRKAGLYDIKGVTVKAIQTIHGAGMGHNLIFVVEAEGLRIAHLGDTGNIPGREIAVKAGGRIDVLMIPVDGIYTLTLEEADRMVGDLKPFLIFPMHFKTNKAGGSLAGVDQFIKGKEQVKQIPQSEIEVTRKNLPDHPEIVLLQFEK